MAIYLPSIRQRTQGDVMPFGRLARPGDRFRASIGRQRVLLITGQGVVRIAYARCTFAANSLPYAEMPITFALVGKRIRAAVLPRVPCCPAHYGCSDPPLFIGIDL